MAAQDQQAGQDDPQTAQRGVEWSNERPSDGVPAPHLSSLPGTAGLEEQTAAATPLPLKVLVVGGSISGCCTALALQELGCEVHIFERTPGYLQGQGAGLNIQADMEQFLVNFGVCKRLEDLCIQLAGRQYVDRAGRVVASETKPQQFTAWDVLYRALRDKAAATYHIGSLVTGVDLRTDGVTITLEDGSQHEGDLLVGADGAGSVVRTLLLPEARSTYTRYVAWRGYVQESECPKAVADFVGNRFTLFQGANFHILAYLIPGPAGEREPGKRRINWVWYWNTPESELNRILTDCNGERHPYSIPRGLLRKDVGELRKRIAREVLPEGLAGLVAATPDIFVQTIQDLLAPTFVVGGRACLVGDSGSILRPHTAAGTTKGAINAWALAKALGEHCGNLGAALQQYDEKMRPLALYLTKVGQSIGNKSQFPLLTNAANGVQPAAAS